MHFIKSTQRWGAEGKSLYLVQNQKRVKFKALTLIEFWSIRITSNKPFLVIKPFFPKVTIECLLPIWSIFEHAFMYIIQCIVQNIHPLKLFGSLKKNSIKKEKINSRLKVSFNCNRTKNSKGKNLTKLSNRTL